MNNEVRGNENGSRNDEELEGSGEDANVETDEA